jgi:hypothetical protein
VTSRGRTIPLPLAEALRDQFPKDGLILNAPLEIKPDKERLRMMLRDVKAGATGSVNLPTK